MSFDLSKINTHIDSLNDLCASEKNILKYLVGIGSKVGDFSKISVSRETIRYKVSLAEHPLRKCNITQFSTATEWDVNLYMQTLIKKKYISIVAKHYKNIPYTYAVNMEKLGISKVEDKKEIESEDKRSLAQITYDDARYKIRDLEDIHRPSKLVLDSIIRADLLEIPNTFSIDISNAVMKTLFDKDYLSFWVTPDTDQTHLNVNYFKIFCAGK